MVRPYMPGTVLFRTAPLDLAVGTPDVDETSFKLKYTVYACNSINVPSLVDRRSMYLKALDFGLETSSEL